MLKLNNKGQTLVLFVILLPLILLMLTLVYDFGNALYEKERMNNTSYIAINYGLDKIKDINENDLIDLIMKNSSDMNKVDVLIENDTITIKLSKKVKGIIGKVFNFDLIEVNSEYVGKFDSDKKIIERVK